VINNFTVLFVEDDTDTQMSMELMLGSDVKEFYQAYDGEEGLEMYKQKKPDIIISDVNMPHLDGLSMIEEIKKIDPNMPIIIMSAFDDSVTLRRAINVGVDFFTLKPINTDLLYKKLNIIANNLHNEAEVKKMKEKELEDLYALAHYDELTKLPNRFLFNMRLDEAFSEANRKSDPFSLFFIDLDDFKKINDTYGHLAGDFVLKNVSKNVSNIIRTEDTFARISGDEFSLIVESTNVKEDLEILANKLLQAISIPMEFEGNSLQISSSIGISTFPSDATTKAKLIGLADTAMYKAKGTGKSNYVFYDDIKE